MKFFSTIGITFILGFFTSYAYDYYKSITNKLYISKVQFIHLDSEINYGSEVLNMELLLNKTEGSLFDNFTVSLVAKNNSGGEFKITTDAYGQINNIDKLTFDILKHAYPKLCSNNGKLGFKTIVINPNRNIKNNEFDYIKIVNFDELFIRYQYSYDSNLISKEIKFDYQDALAIILNSPGKSNLFQEYKKH